VGRYWIVAARSGIDSEQVCRVIRGKYVHKSLLSAGEGRKCGISARDGWNTEGRGGGKGKKKAELRTRIQRDV